MKSKKSKIQATIKLENNNVEVYTATGYKSLSWVNFIKEIEKTPYEFYAYEAKEIMYRLVENYGQKAEIKFQGEAIIEVKVKGLPFVAKSLKAILPSEFETLKDEWDHLVLFQKYFGKSATLASAAFKQLKKYGYDIEKTNSRFDSKFRPFYFGGRCEAPQTGKIKEDDLIVYDINSAYPHAMTQEHWFGSDCVCSDSESDIINQSLVEVECMSLGALAIRDEEGRITFPIAKNTYNTTGWEYLTAKKLGLLKDVVVKTVWTPKETKNFAPFVNHFYNLKKNATNEQDRMLAKLILNSVYGKFAQDPRKFEDKLLLKAGEIPDEVEGWEIKGEFDDKSGETLTIWGKATLSEKALTYTDFNNVATACSITGFVRAMLLQAKHTVKGFVYCDTDSITCKRTDTLKVGKELGDWKVEAVVKDMYVGGKKLYAIKTVDGKWKTASKGVRLTPEEIVSVCAGNEVRYKFDKLAYSITKGIRETKRTIKM